MLNRRYFLPVLFLIALTFAGCEASYHARETQSGLDGDRLTVGTVQREIHKGMSSAEVAEALGSPNIVSTDEQGREVWVYDKTATDVVVSGSASWFVIAGVESGATSRSQRTLTIIIKYDENGRVRDVAYHSSSF